MNFFLQNGLVVGMLLSLYTSVAVAESADAHHHHHHQAIEAAAPTQSSVYSLASSWTAADGRALALRELQGKAVVLAMFYGTCTAACPILVDLMKQGENALTESERESTSFVLVTFDPERDTLSALRAYQAKRELDDSRWILLRGSAEDTLELSVLLGVKYKSNEDGSFSHSNVITVLNPKGEIVGQHMGLQPGGEKGGEKIEEIVRRALPQPSLKAPTKK